MKSNDYFSKEEKRKYYHRLSINRKANPEEKQRARKKYMKIRESKPLVYQPKFIRSMKRKSSTLGDFLKMLTNKRNRFNFLSDSHPKYINTRQATIDKEIKRLKHFRHKHYVSYEDPIDIMPTHKE